MFPRCEIRGDTPSCDSCNGTVCVQKHLRLDLLCEHTAFGNSEKWHRKAQRMFHFTAFFFLFLGIFSRFFLLQPTWRKRETLRPHYAYRAGRESFL